MGPTDDQDLPEADAHRKRARSTAVRHLAARFIEELPCHDSVVSAVLQAVDGVDALCDVLQVCHVPAGDARSFALACAY